MSSIQRKNLVQFIVQLLHRAGGAGILLSSSKEYSFAVYLLLSALSGRKVSTATLKPRSILCSRPFAGPRYVALSPPGGVSCYKDNQTQTEVYIKWIPRTRMNERRAEVELHKLYSLGKHPFVSELRDLIVCEQHIGCVMEYARAGNLHEYVTDRCSLAEGLARWFFQQLVLALEYYHLHGLSGVDLKPQNLLLQQELGLPLPVLKLSDCATTKFAVCSSSTLHSSRVGDPRFMSPELVAYADERKYSTKQTDVWSAGIVLYFMLFGTLPYNIPAENEQPAHVRLILLFDQMTRLGGVTELKFPKPVSSDVQELLRGMLQPNPSQRMTLQQVATHPWFTTNLPSDLKILNSPSSMRTACLLKIKSLGRTDRATTSNDSSSIKVVPSSVKAPLRGFHLVSANGVQIPYLSVHGSEAGTPAIDQYSMMAAHGNSGSLVCGKRLRNEFLSSDNMALFPGIKRTAVSPFQSCGVNCGVAAL